MTGGLSFTSHDDPPAADARVVDEGLEAANFAAAPLHEVRPLACFARLPSGEVVGGAVGRTWGGCGEIQQLWVAESHRHQGIGTRLVREFEAAARGRGCRVCYLETLSFQAPRFYRGLGYLVKHENTVLPHGIVKYLMMRDIAGPDGAPP